MSFSRILTLLSPAQQTSLSAVKSNAETLLNHTARFKFFTLHGTAHLDNLFIILDLLLSGGIELRNEELFLLTLAICIHDLGMVAALRGEQIATILEGKPEFPDPASLEDYIRDAHHELVDNYIEDHVGFLTSAGLSASQIGQVKDISRCHRKVILEQQSGYIKYLGALLRVVDELDIGHERAPINVLYSTYGEMDSTSCWHWFKHNITESWQLDHTVFYKTENERKSIEFRVGVRPTRKESLEYWLNQTGSPILRVLRDEGANKIIREKFGVEIALTFSRELSKVNRLDATWEAIEKKALTSSHPVILVIDDEFNKMEDLFLPLMDRFHVMSALNAKDAISKLEATSVKLAIVDMQIGSGSLWRDDETGNFKYTGVKLCHYINEHYPGVKVGILSGTRHNLPPLDSLRLAFHFKKPVDLDVFANKIGNVLS